PGRRLGNARRGPALRHARRHLQYAWRAGVSKTGAARRHRDPGGRRLCGPQQGACRMTALERTRLRPNPLGLLARRVNMAVVAFLVLYGAIGVLQPSYLEPASFMNFLRRAAPLAVLASGQLFVLVAGGFDLSMGSLVTLTVIGGSMLAGNDPQNTWWTIAVLYAIGLSVGVLNGL